MTWAQRAGEIIAEIGKTIPPGTPLKERRRILDEHGGGCTSWGKKTWARAKRQYLEGHGQPKGYGKRKPDDGGLPLFDQVRH